MLSVLTTRGVTAIALLAVILKTVDGRSCFGNNTDTSLSRERRIHLSVISDGTETCCDHCCSSREACQHCVDTTTPENAVCCQSQTICGSCCDLPEGACGTEPYSDWCGAASGDVLAGCCRFGDGSSSGTILANYHNDASITTRNLCQQACMDLANCDTYEWHDKVHGRICELFDSDADGGFFGSDTSSSTRCAQSKCRHLGCKYPETTLQASSSSTGEGKDTRFGSFTNAEQVAADEQSRSHQTNITIGAGAALLVALTVVFVIVKRSRAKPAVTAENKAVQPVQLDEQTQPTVDFAAF